MTRFTTRQAAKRLGLNHDTLAHYVEVGKVPSPEVIELGKGQRVVHAWTEEEIKNLRKLLPKIANGRKTRYQKLREKQKTPAGVPVSHKSKPQKKKTKKQIPRPKGSE
jgi:DNA-binding transcriptional MerR regulator